MAVSYMNLIHALVSQLRETQDLACGGCGSGGQRRAATGGGGRRRAAAGGGGRRRAAAASRPKPNFKFRGYNYADDLNVSFSDVCISTEPQMEFSHTDLFNDMHSMIPSGCKFLSKQDPIHTERFRHYLELMSSEKFPISNMCYQLFSDVFQWYSCVSSTDMRYCDDTNKFWCIGKRLFHGKFIPFMRGPAGKCVASDTSHIVHSEAACGQ